MQNIIFVKDIFCGFQKYEMMLTEDTLHSVLLYYVVFKIYRLLMELQNIVIQVKSYEQKSFFEPNKRIF
jgi:hypothetical protein